MTITPEERQQLIDDLIAEGMHPAEARVTVAVGLGESDGDVEVVDKHGRPIKQSEPPNALDHDLSKRRNDEATNAKS